MKISIRDEGKKFVIPIPTSLIFSSLALCVLKNAPGTKGVDLSGLKPKHMRQIRRCIRRMKKIHKGWCLVDILDGDTSVKIKI